MKDAVKVAMATSSHMTLSWHSYSPTPSAAGTRSHDVKLSSYEVEMTADDRNWAVVGSVVAKPSSDQELYSYKVRGLIAGKKYRFRLVIVWLNGNKPTRSIPGPPTRWIRTHCREFNSYIVTRNMTLDF